MDSNGTGTGSIRRTKQRDPQIVVDGKLNQGQNSDFITFRLNVLSIVELIFIVTIPAEGTFVAPVYVKFKLDRTKNESPIRASFTEDE